MADSVLELLEKRVDDLVTMPGVAVQLFEKCSDPELKIPDLVALIEADQVVASRILRLANSAYYGRSAAVSSLRDAVMLLGLESVRALGLGIGVYRLFDQKDARVPQGELEQLWQHSIAVALCAREISRRIGVRERDRAFVGGLLHDIGQLVLLQYMPDRYATIVKSIAVSGMGLEQAERDALGTDHAEVGAWLLERWRLPAELVTSIQAHHQELPTEQATGRPSLAAIVQVADWLATSQGLGPPWPRDRQRQVPACRSSLTLEDDALLQLCFGLDKRVSQLTEAMGLGPVSADVFQKALYRANRALAQMAVDLDSRGRRLQHSVDALSTLQSVTAAVAAADDVRAVMEAAVRAIAAVPTVEYVQCAVPLAADLVLQGTASPLAGRACSVEMVTCDRMTWERSREPRRLSREYAEAGFRVLDGSQGMLCLKTGADQGDAAVPLDVGSLAGVLGLAFERALAHRDLTALAQRRTEDLARRAGTERPSDPEAADHRLRLLGEMSAGAAHDLNNALAIMLGQAQLGLIADDIDEVRQHLQTIERAAKDCAATVRRLQEFARGTRKHPREETFDLAAAARETVDITKPRWRDEAQRRGAHIQVVVDLPEPLPVRGSASALREVLTNLIFNAVDAMPGGGTVAVRGWREGHEVHVSVRDTGVGLSAQVRDRLFEPFFTTKGDQGHGLGLSVCKRIVEEHGGRIEVLGRQGSGATFVLTLPVGADVQEPRREEAKAMGGRSLSVLVVDDEPQIREVLLRMLRLDGHTPTAVTTAQEAIEVFASQPFDLVLTDLGLPDMPGWDVVRAVKEANPDLPVILITGWTEEEERQGGQGGADAVLVKPFGIGELRRVIESTGGALTSL